MNNNVLLCVIQEIDMTTVRLPDDIEKKLATLSRTKKKSKSELIKEALEQFFHKEGNEKDSYELGREYFGQYGSGEGNLSIEYKRLLKGKINAKRNPH
jgi:predicted DNA-binding protein